VPRRSGSFSTRKGHGTRRLTSWFVGPHGTTVLSGNGATVFPVSVQSTDEGLTLIRVRGSLLLYLSAAAAALDGFRWGFGMAVVSENAAGIGVSAVPSPLTDITWDGWMVYSTGVLKAVDSTVQFGNAGSATHRIEIDSKAMRKFKFSDVLVAMLEVTDEVGTAVLRADLSSRILSKLP